MAAKLETISPLLSRIQKQEPLTLKNLAFHVPRVKFAKEAKNTLHNSESLSSEEKQKLHEIIVQGDSSKEELVMMALPLVSTIARTEFNRRMSWNSRVTLDDMIQEGIGGFLRGIESYNPEGGHTSPTNYLGQWITSDIRRHVESLDHDFSIPHETIERHRKIRAIRSRLYNELSRNPTDEELLERANNPDSRPVNKMGRVDKKSYTGKKITQKNIDEERTFAASTGRLETLNYTDDESSEHERKSNPLIGDNETISNYDVEERSVRQSMAKLFETVFKRMNLGRIQEEIIRQKFGLPPYHDEIPLAGIAKNTNVSKYKVNQVITAFSQEMASQGSLFHKTVTELPMDEIESLGLGWVIRIVGEYKKPKIAKTSHVLIQDMTPPPKKPRKSFGEENRETIYNHTAYYRCKEGHEHTKKLIAEGNKRRAMQICQTCGGSVEFIRIENNK